MTAGITVELGDAALAAAHRAAVCRMRHRVFSAPPFVASSASMREYEALFDGYLREPGFGVALALHSDRVVGFAYCHRLSADHRWWEGFPGGVPEDLSAEWEGRTCTLVDLAVEESRRRTGVGRMLVDSLLSTRREERALLSAQPTAAAAHAFYRATGWELVGRKGPIPGVVPPYWDIYLRRIPREEGSAHPVARPPAPGRRGAGGAGPRG
ncbi:MAG TPA: GNAT family N-acetyltransferase [Streptomyces sp.]|uniref:GNAT family N-acetyltransferase n=1 Tax=Streptomyces sp. TaxID=1931 RepID=UPI002D564A98|nr:GNAT family N-acetyltransferase [Streptomyces sp.]HZG02546.1 GNAT family N-acetyltransferase [Streptomyces sp.]